MLINISKNIVQSVEIKTPSFYKKDDEYSMINDRGILIRVCKKAISYTEPNEMFYDTSISNAVSGQQISELEFMQKYTEVESKLGKEIGITV